MRMFAQMPKAMVATTVKPSRRPDCLEMERLPHCEGGTCVRGSKRVMP
ncbi:hypothetical protein SAMN05444149_101699 [Pseudosulfitobacter pseudonitzschiae]|nr:hypothetical protein SAMN05444149_101699 [Pseudosulfitobacter pseudonitzschiae]